MQIACVHECAFVLFCIMDRLKESKTVLETEIFDFVPS